MLFDTSQNGHLKKSDLRRISNELDIYLTSEQIDLIFSRASVDQEVITVEDFEYFMQVEGIDW